MRRNIFRLLIVCLTLCSSLASAEKLSPGIPVDLHIPVAPTPVKANGKIRLLYELHITNLRAKSLQLSRIIVAKGATERSFLASYEAPALTERLGRPGAPADLGDKRVIGGGMQAVAFLELDFERPTDVPRVLMHRLFFKADEKGEDVYVDGAEVTVRQVAPVTISPPLRGLGWVALSGMSNDSVHRRTIVAVDGKARIAQRFAADWTKIGKEGLAFSGDPAKNANWAAYGAEVLAVANAVVVDVKDGIPDNDPTADKKAVPINLETVGGNYVILDLGGGNFAFYAHLQPNTIRVKVGDHVKRGQTLALLGNSGNSDAPHLHFHVSDSNSPLGAEGLPYVFDAFESKGELPSKRLLAEGGWKAWILTKAEKRLLEMPTENTIAGFP
ncbi:peptidoglycan DD-metalloendopeptidase family protein [Pseudoduganella eburnea]|uniref:Peptidoglycan DD-metalloendopeptidase family protein n=1 Tax=Massilia eburnea TaxID=1776165 RepID=A0A6L6QJI1_9BURK|nr:M23 family metallopeptidase [Massilia eburnea]MTW12234.1 peptidoglycan DD-metalloendopeptidase family protein [Massilia eburnea]